MRQQLPLESGLPPASDMWVGLVPSEDFPLTNGYAVFSAPLGHI
jgi:hypothetical protein